MRKLIYLFIVFGITSCGGSTAEQAMSELSTASETKNIEQTEIGQVDTIITDVEKDSADIESKIDLKNYWQESLNMSFKMATLYDIKDTIHADFNGDGIIDEAVYLDDSETSGIIIMHGNSHEVIRIGFGVQFAHMTEFDWVDYWGLVKDKETSETTFEKGGDVSGSHDVTLQNLSIALIADEVGGGLIAYLNGKYVWIHQTC
ncbi:hypothetical protein [Crocinitomix catalasitica]|uniref:hypothetical protein n=1 Tax=Crocinitomix catalasitica TaxID=184607 RepID=UPI000489E523|nr:hypothetical protein [Crocinitomix catalasitica]